MKNSIIILFGLVAAVLCDEDVIQLVATEERQNLTSPSLEGIARPHDFKWRISLNTTEPDRSLFVTLHYLNVPETINCSGSYLEISIGNTSMGQRCTELRDAVFYGFGSYVDVTYHLGSENGTHEFQMSYIETQATDPSCSICVGNPNFIIWIIIVTLFLVCCLIITCYCAKRPYRKQNQNVAKKPGNSATQTDFVFTGPPSYEDAKGDDQPPPYSTVVHA